MKGIAFIPILVVLMLGAGAVWVSTQVIKDTTTTIGKLVIVTVGSVVALGALYLFFKNRRISKGSVLATAIFVVIGMAIIIYGMTALSVIP